MFSRPLLSCNPLNTIRVLLRQFVSDGNLEHCGIIVRNPHDGNVPYVLEVNMNTPSFYSSKLWFWKSKKDRCLKVTRLEERVLTGIETTVCVRCVDRRWNSPKNKHKTNDQAITENYYSEEESHARWFEEWLEYTLHRKQYDNFFARSSTATNSQDREQQDLAPINREHVG
ncbi:hypothetical protein RFI_06845 [Reticulomyxa filosa]|uniref:Uncharacterized protein n=1 Tax=Reticulomyxa filosa TaxID=46433 RepID=X6NWR5_RETFI|nr:hypothetical protein RFI_06845 [Reticulomyxa filosa]|eukprot:ETO30274.1 hypothetical protein RFI_06845 [Reticulomyxa filosa]